jgi:uncharacterized membrane protein YeiB
MVGLDVARGLAVLGMVAAHVGDDSAWPWLQIFDGRSAATFATLAGVSAAIMSRPTAGGAEAGRPRIVRRALVIGVIGLLLYPFTPAIADILPTYAVMFLLLAALLELSSTMLVTLAGVFMLFGPPVAQAAQAVAAPGRVPWPLDVLVGQHYPGVVWMAYLLVGLAVGRLELRSTTVRIRLALLGVTLAALGYATGAWATQAGLGERWAALLDTAPHASTTPEVTGNLGVVLVVLAGCLALSDAAPWLVTPVAATGAMALSAYVTQLLVISALGPDVVWHPQGNGVLIGLWVALIAASWAWRIRSGRGPLERLVHVLSTAPSAQVPTRRT